MRTERHRYTMWSDGRDGEELYDYSADPRELRNLAAAPESAQLKGQLRARLDSILSPGRGRAFDAQEQARAAEMIAQGYADRPFSDAIVETDRASLVDTTETVVAACRRLVGLATAQGS